MTNTFVHQRSFKNAFCTKVPTTASWSCETEAFERDFLQNEALLYCEHDLWDGRLLWMVVSWDSDLSDTGWSWLIWLWWWSVESCEFLAGTVVMVNVLDIGLVVVSCEILVCGVAGFWMFLVIVVLTLVIGDCECRRRRGFQFKLPLIGACPQTGFLLGTVGQMLFKCAIRLPRLDYNQLKARHWVCNQGARHQRGHPMARLWQVIRSLVVCGTPDHVKTVPWAAIARDPMIWFAFHQDAQKFGNW